MRFVKLMLFGIIEVVFVLMVLFLCLWFYFLTGIISSRREDGYCEEGAMRCSGHEDIK